jgi:hypothetical protein
LDANRFDALARTLGSAATRRAALRAAGAAVAGGLLAVLGRSPVTAFDNDFSGDPIHETITKRALRGRLDPDYLDDVVSANRTTDVCNTDECFYDDEALHYDSAKNRDVICNRWKFGQNAYLNNAVRAVTPFQLDRNRDKALTYFGRAIHALQDFHSHTNWIEYLIEIDSTYRKAPIIQNCTPSALPPKLQSGYFDFDKGVLKSGCPRRRVNGQESRAKVCVDLPNAPIRGEACLRRQRLKGEPCEADVDCCSGVCSNLAPPSGFTYCHEHLNKDYPNDKEGRGSGSRRWKGTNYYTVAKLAAETATSDLFDEFRRRVIVQTREKYPCYDGSCLFRKLVGISENPNVPFDPDDPCYARGTACTTSTGDDGTCCQGKCQFESAYDDDDKNCGRCGKICPAGTGCADGICRQPGPTLELQLRLANGTPLNPATAVVHTGDQLVAFFLLTNTTPTDVVVTGYSSTVFDYGTTCLGRWEVDANGGVWGCQGIYTVRGTDASAGHLEFGMSVHFASGASVSRQFDLDVT